ncbi:MAG TPA: hypothetical protein VJX67_14675 [Blastocatellia bacterium]|nr:hypothetical protein [Blastocatellia bacterium]
MSANESDYSKGIRRPEDGVSKLTFQVVVVVAVFVIGIIPFVRATTQAADFLNLTPACTELDGRCLSLFRTLCTAAQIACRLL